MEGSLIFVSLYSTLNHLSKTTLLVLNVPIVSISITVLKALKDSEVAGHRKLPAASEQNTDLKIAFQCCMMTRFIKKIKK